MKTSILQKKQLVAKTVLVALFGMISTVPMTFAVPIPSGIGKTSEKENVALPEEPSAAALFEYKIETRPDPFVPFISEKATSANINEIVPVAEQLSGMQLFEPGQLNLVAIVMAGKSDFAMAEDTTGKGYILHTGMKIGKRGIITAIKANKVTVEETAFTRAGKKLTSTIVMLLKKEGEE
jgi:type IV pilus assembly protein PilP